MRLIGGIPVWGNADEPTLDQIKMVAQTGPVAAVALMADNHKGYSMPIGGVVAYRNAVSPTGVGVDIGCGIKATKTNINLRDFAIGETKPTLEAWADRIAAEVSFGMGRTNATPVDHNLFYSDLWKISYLEPLLAMARAQLGTVGGGNHFVDLLADGDGFVWIMCHFGSRGLGHKTCAGFINLAEGREFDAKPKGEKHDDPPVILHLDDWKGDMYMACMELAGRYAYAGRDAVTEQVLGILGASAVESVHNHHNFAWRETHTIGNETGEFVVVRKGATPAFPGQRGAVGGSMGDDSVILHGIDSNHSQFALYSTMHGAGRVMSRTQAAGKNKWMPVAAKVAEYERRKEAGEFDALTPLEQEKKRTWAYKKVPQRVGEGLISPEAMQEWLLDKGVILRGGDLDEAPQAYRRLHNVLNEHHTTTQVETYLRPLVVVMAGAEEYGPYKD